MAGFTIFVPRGLLPQLRSQPYNIKLIHNLILYLTKNYQLFRQYRQYYLSRSKPEAIAKISEVLDTALEELQDTGEPDVVREHIATRIIAATRLAERDPARLLEVAVRRPG